MGVSTHLPRNSFFAALFPNGNGIGIVGVHPLSILLEPLELQEAGGLEELLELLEVAGYDVEESVLREPFWLQVSVTSDLLLIVYYLDSKTSKLKLTWSHERMTLMENVWAQLDSQNAEMPHSG